MLVSAAAVSKQKPKLVLTKRGKTCVLSVSLFSGIQLTTEQQNVDKSSPVLIFCFHAEAEVPPKNVSSTKEKLKVVALKKGKFSFFAANSYFVHSYSHKMHFKELIPQNAMFKHSNMLSFLVPLTSKDKAKKSQSKEGDFNSLNVIPFFHFFKIREFE